jgi:DNA-directed RNA polymerase subunit RPC12/RpoP
MSKEIIASKKCPNCDWRIIDKVTPTTGIIQMKCPRCKVEVKVDLSLRKNIIKYRKK